MLFKTKPNIYIMYKPKRDSWQLSPSPVFSYKETVELTRPAVNYSQHDTPCRPVVVHTQDLDRSLNKIPPSLAGLAKTGCSTSKVNEYELYIII